MIKQKIKAEIQILHPKDLSHLISNNGMLNTYFLRIINEGRSMLVPIKEKYAISIKDLFE